MDATKDRTASFAGETWTVDSGREVHTPDGVFYLTYGKDEKTSAPHYRDFCKLDDIAASMPLLPLIAEYREALAALHNALMRDGVYANPEGDAAYDVSDAMHSARALLARDGKGE